jgi:hypothetical protein
LRSGAPPITEPVVGFDPRFAADRVPCSLRRPEAIVTIWLIGAALAQEPAPIPPLARDVTAFLPDATTATLQSTIVGFGSGHFYAGEKPAGAVFATSQGVGVLIVGLGALALAAEQEERPRDRETSGHVTMIGVGGTVFALARTFDIALAPRSVRKARERMLAAGR